MYLVRTFVRTFEGTFVWTWCGLGVDLVRTFVCTWYVLLSVLGTQQGRAQSLNGVSRLMVRMSGSSRHTRIVNAFSNSFR